MIGTNAGGQEDQCDGKVIWRGREWGAEVHLTPKHQKDIKDCDCPNTLRE